MKGVGESSPHVVRGYWNLLPAEPWGAAVVACRRTTAEESFLLRPSEAEPHPSLLGEGCSGCCLVQKGEGNHGDQVPYLPSKRNSGCKYIHNAFPLRPHPSLHQIFTHHFNIIFLERQRTEPMHV